MEAGRPTTRRRRWPLAVGLASALALPLAAQAQWPAADAPADAARGPVDGSTLAGDALRLGALVLAGLGAAAVLAIRRRRQTLSALPAPDLAVLARLNLGPRQSVVLVRCGDRRVLLGLTAGSVTALGDWPLAPAGGVPSTDESRRLLQALAERLGVGGAEAAAPRAAAPATRLSTEEVRP